MDKDDVVPMHNGISLSRGKDEIMPSAVLRMHLEISTQSEVSQEKTNIIWWTHLQNRKTESQIQETHSVIKAEKGRGTNEEFGISRKW